MPRMGRAIENDRQAENPETRQRSNENSPIFSAKNGDQAERGKRDTHQREHRISEPRPLGGTDIETPYQQKRGCREANYKPDPKHPPKRNRLGRLRLLILVIFIHHRISFASASSEKHRPANNDHSQQADSEGHQKSDPDPSPLFSEKRGEGDEWSRPENNQNSRIQPGKGNGQISPEEKHQKPDNKQYPERAPKRVQLRRRPLWMRIIPRCVLGCDILFFTHCATPSNSAFSSSSIRSFPSR